MTNFTEHTEYVQPDWVDAQGRLRPTYFVVIFDHAIDLLYDGLGIGWPYRRATNSSTFTLEAHALLEWPVPAGETVLVRSRILGVDAKRIHIAQEMFRPGQSVRAALMEQLGIHVDLTVRRSSPFPPDRLAAIQAAMAAQDGTAPVGVGRRIGLAAA
jgi:acyl-CoA thioester hydrolase